MSHALVKVVPRPAGFTAVCECGQTYTSSYQRTVLDWHANHEQEALDLTLLCPECGADLGYEQDGQVYSRRIRIALPNGTALYRCPDCHRAWHAESDPTRRAQAAPYLTVCNEGIPA
jgi:DNA-directed RNA polymerase subunit RPC12/RpoP